MLCHAGDSSLIYVSGNGRIVSSREKVSVKPPNPNHPSWVDTAELKAEYL